MQNTLNISLQFYPYSSLIFWHVDSIRQLIFYGMYGHSNLQIRETNMKR